MLASLKMIRDKFGGAEQYMIEKCDLSKQDVANIRSNLIVDIPAIHRKTSHSL